MYDVKTSIIKDCNGERKTIRYFTHQLLKYVWDEKDNVFKYLQGLDNGTTTLSKLLEKCHGLTAEEYENQYVYCTYKIDLSSFFFLIKAIDLPMFSNTIIIRVYIII